MITPRMDICQQVLCAQAIVLDLRPATDVNTHYCHRFNGHPGGHCATNSEAHVAIRWDETTISEDRRNYHRTCN